jgi:hypothetical protein
MRKTREIIDLHPFSDNMPLRYDSEVSFEGVILEREDWNKVPSK